MTAIHTPGPWKACGENYPSGPCECGQVWSIPADVPVATCALKWEGGEFTREAQQANARLIAAAPDLLLVAKCCLAMARDDAIPPDWDWIRKVITKAEGAKQ